MQISNLNNSLLKGENMKNYIDDIITVKQFIAESKPALANTAQRAANYLKEYYPSAKDDELVVITVEGYYCIAWTIHDFAPYILANTIAPFDKDRIYPRQGLVTKYSFKYYNS